MAGIVGPLESMTASASGENVGRDTATWLPDTRRPWPPCDSRSRSDTDCSCRPVPRDALVVVDEESRWRRHVRTSLPQFVVAQRGCDSVRRAAVQVKLVIHRRTMTTEVDDSGEPTHDRRVRTVLPVQRAHGVPPGAEMPFHLGTRGFYITFPRFSWSSGGGMCRRVHAGGGADAINAVASTTALAIVFAPIGFVWLPGVS
jgi:hypothetical protein